MQSRKAFTLVELLVCIALLTILVLLVGGLSAAAYWLFFL